VEPRADRARRDGYRAALVRAGLPPLPVVRWEPGNGAAPPLGPDPPTAAFCSNDLGAIALLEHCDRVGLRVPQDLSVVGFDDIDIASYAGLTTVRQPLFESGRRGAELLLHALEGHPHPPGVETLPLELVVRGTTAPPR
jgi:DNA-binding LacI/PurR family transcriptional regulator